MNKVQEIFLKLSRNIVYLLFTLIILHLFLISLFTSCTIAYTDEHTFFNKDFPQLLVPGLVILLLMLFWLKRYIENRRNKQDNEVRLEKLYKGILAGITVCWFLFLFWWIMKAPAIPTADQYSVFIRAKEFLAGDYTCWELGNYMHMYPYQNTMVLFYSVFHLLFGEYALLAVKLFNMACWYMCILAICKLTERYFGSKTAIWTYLALLLFFPMCSYVTFIYGTVPGMCCSLWGIFLEKKFEETRKIKHLLGIGILLLLAVMWKSNYIIFLIAVIIMLAILGIRERYIIPFLGILWILIIYFAGTQGALAFVESTTGEDTGSGILFIGSIVDGLQESVMAPGWYSGYAEILYSKHKGDASVMTPIAIEDLRSTLTLFADQPEYAIRFFFRKIASMWSAPFLECTTLITKAHPRSYLDGIFEEILCDGQLLNILLLIGLNILQSVLYFGVLLFLIFGRKNAGLEKAGFIICFLGGFIFYFFWEAKCQYILPYYLLLFPYGIEGFRTSLEHFSKIWEGWKEQKQNSKKGDLAIWWKDANIRILLVVFMLIILIEILPESITGSTFKIGSDTTEYIWFCENNI